MLRCYFAAIPFIVWALMLQFGLADDDGTRVPFLLVESVAICISIQGLHAKYRRM